MSTTASAYPSVLLGDACRFIGGGTPSRKRDDYFNGNIPWATVKDFKTFRILDTEDHISEAGLADSASNLVPAGTILLVTRVGLGKVAIAERPLAINQDIKAVIPAAEILPEFLFWFLLSKGSEIERMGTGATVKGVTLSDVRAIRMPLPPIPEQRRVVDILSRAEGIVRLQREARKKAAEIIPALFLDMFGDPATNLKGWPVFALGNLIVDGPQNGLYKHSSHYGDGTPILRIDAFYDGQVRDLMALKRVMLTPEEAVRFRLQSRDLVINRVNSPEYLGKSTIIPTLAETTVFESNMMRLTVDESHVLPEYVIELLQTRYARTHFLSNAKHAINQSSINQQDVKSLSVPVPPLPPQQDFVELAAQVYFLQSQQTAALQKSETVFDALLSRTFAN